MADRGSCTRATIGAAGAVVVLAWPLVPTARAGEAIRDWVGSGDGTSEQAHGFEESGSVVAEGGLGEKCRRSGARTAASTK